MTRNTLIRRLAALAVLAALGLGLTGCSALNKRQAEHRQPTPAWNDARYEHSTR